MMKLLNPVLKTSLLFGVLTLLLSCQPENQKADLIITNANIWTGNEAQPTAEAMASAGDSILAIGINDDMLSFKSSATKVIDVNGGFITPGFIDTHVHLIEGGFNLSSVKLRDAKTPEEFSQRIADFVQTVPSGI
jgi:predicted amidohydrolase YtcJ